VARRDAGHIGRPGGRRRAGWRSVAAAALILTLGSPAAAQAAWVTAETALIASASAGRLAVTQSGFGSLAMSYTSSALTDTAPVTVANTGNVPAPYTLTFGAQTATALAGAVEVRVWSVTSEAGCTAATAAGGVAGKSWTTVGAVMGTLAPSTSAYWCVRSSVTQAQRFALVGGTVSATASLVASQGSWSSTAGTTATQSVANTLTPGTVTRTAWDDASMTLTWAAPSDTAAVTGYRVYRDGVVVGSVPVSSRSYIDSGLSVSTTYSYTVAAITSGSPVDVSPTSTPASFITNARSAAAWYRVTNVGTGLCVDAEGGTPANGTALISYACNGGDNQAWRFGASGSYFKVTPRNSSTLYWDSDATKVLLQRADSTFQQLWTPTDIASAGGTFTMRNRSGSCLTVTGATTAGGNPQLTIATCVAGSLNQAFTLTNDG
jgi:hypothetical protein